MSKKVSVRKQKATKVKETMKAWPTYITWRRVKNVLPFCLFSVLTLTVGAQTQPEYRLEVGGGVGAVTYLGDFNGNLLKGIQPMGSLLVKYRFTPRQAMALNVSYGQLKGEQKNVNTYYPNLTGYSFKSSLVDVGLRYEYNFWPFGTGEEYRGAKRVTPYIFLGGGVSIAKPNNGEAKTVVAMNIPLGGGVKYKMADRLNLGVEWAIHFSGTDLLDGVKDPYGIETKGLFKNTDCYSQLRLSVTYDLWAKCKTCHNDRD